MTTQQMIDVMQAYERGEQIEYRSKENGTEWSSCNPIWDWAHVDYRVKPKPKYRSYQDAKEFLKAQEKHGRWLESKEVPGCYFMPVRIVANTVTLDMVNACGYLNPKQMGFRELLETYRWKDCTKCGIKLPD